MLQIYGKIFLFVIIQACQIVRGLPRTNLTQGIVEGTYRKSYGGRTFSAFEGIPYAKPPLGELRFREPLEAPHWNDILVVNKTYICCQMNGTGFILGSEDCLFLNVYIPKMNIAKSDNFDVVVHIHGGLLSTGSPRDMAISDYLMDKDLIMVSFNYRLGAAGFLSTGDDVVPGNNGLKDQILALKWIQSNIKDFGGNPNSVTLTGFSSGAGSVQMHYLSPLARGLFHRGFAISSIVTNSGLITLNPAQRVKLLAQKVKCEGNSSEIMVKCLRNVPIQDLVNTNITFKPAVEKGNLSPYLPADPYKLMKDKRVYDVPWIASNVINEALFSLDSVYKNRSEIFSIYNNWTEWGKRMLDFEEFVDKGKLNRTLKRIKEFYLDESELTEENGLEKLNRVLSDRRYFVGIDFAIRSFAAAIRSPVYVYMFKFVPEDNLQFFGPHAASHGVDDKLMFKFPTNPRKLKPQGEKMMRLLIDFVAEFAKSGIPKIGTAKWTPVDPHKSWLNVLEINSPEDIKMTKVKELAPRSFWKSLPIKENLF